MSSARELNIAIAISSFFPDIGGAQITAHKLACHLTDQGHKVVMFSAWSSWRKIGERKKRLGYQLLPLIPGQQSIMPYFGSVYQFAQNRYFSWMQRKYKFDVWQSFGTFPAAVSVARFVSPRGIPHVLRTVGYDIQKDPEIGYGYRFNRKVESLIQAWSIKASKVIALSESVKPDLRDLSVTDDQIEIIPCGVDQSHFESVDIDRTATRKKYGIPLNKFVYVTVGRNHPKKGFSVLLESMSERKRKGTLCNTHMVFVGDKMTKLAPYAAELGIANHATFIEEQGFDSNENKFKVPSKSLVALYKCADACVFPSLLETFAMINIEAMAAGIPVISTDAPGCIETIIDGVDGLVAKAGDPVDLAQKMEQLQHSVKLQSTLIKNGTESVRKKFNWDIVGAKFESLYYSLTGGEYPNGE